MSWNFYPLWGWGYDEYDAFRRRRDADHERARQREEEERRERRRAEERTQALKKHQQEVAFREKQKSLNRKYDTTQAGYGAAAEDLSPSPASTGIISSRSTKLNRGGFFEGSLGVQTHNATSPSFAEKSAQPTARPRAEAGSIRRPQRAALARAGFFDTPGMSHGPDPPARTANGSRPGFFDSAGQSEGNAPEPPRASKGAGSGLMRAGFTSAAPAAQPVGRSLDRFVSQPAGAASAPLGEHVEPGSTTLAGTGKIGGFIRW